MGPLRLDFQLAAKGWLRDRVAQRLAAVRIRPTGELRVVVRTQTDRFFRRDDAIVVREAGNLVERHDFRLRRAADGWRVGANETPESVEAALRWIVGIELLQRGGLLLHASSVVMGGQAHVFLGPSGAGKTTIAMECDADAVLCDEISLVAPQNGAFWAWPSPFWGEGELGVAVAPAPLAGICLLDGRARTALADVGRADAALAVLSRAIDLSADPRAAGLALTAAARIVAEIPVSRLSWRRGDPLRQRLNTSYDRQVA